MNSENQKLFTHIMSERPSYLLLGQDYLKLETGSDPFLTSIFAKYSTENDSKLVQMNSYSDLFEQTLISDPIAARAWISETSRKLTSPIWLDIVSNISWSGIYSSAIDTLLIRSFRNDWRDIQPIFTKKFSPPDSRSRTNLHLTYLFGGIEREDLDERSPLSEIDLIRRNPESTILLSRLKEQITPFGMLFIEGYNPESDWLTSRDLAALLWELSPGQVHIFSFDQMLCKDSILNKLIQSGRIVAHQRSLATVLTEGINSGQINSSERKEFKRDGHFISTNSNSFELPESIWSRISRTANVLDDESIATPKRLSEEGRYAAFRSFLSESGAKPMWQSYGLGFAFERDFEKTLSAAVHERLRTRSGGNDPIILSGQTGTGKSVALAGLAYRIRSEKNCAVLFIEKRSQNLIVSDIDQFCKWAEDTGFPATLIIWDAMTPIDQYNTVLKYLLGRGRNIVMVGSTYKLEVNGSNSRSIITAPAYLSGLEVERFKALLTSFEPSLGEQLDSLLKKHDATLLVALYRLLPDTRGQVRQGLSRETSVAEITLRTEANQIQPEFSGGSLAAAFQRTGIFSKTSLLPNERKEIGGELLSTTEELVGLIMVPGRFGLKIPIELIIRTLGRDKVANFHEIFSSIDIFRWISDSQGNIFLGARHPLEAKLIAQGRLGGPRLEAEFVKKLLIEVTDSDDGSENLYIQFAADLLRSIGPNGPEGKLYSSFYKDIGDCLEKLRFERGIVNPRIMLQEASFLREAVVAMGNEEETITERLDLLDRATFTLKEALKIIPETYRTRRLRSMLLVELASTIGTKVRELLKADDRSDQVMEAFIEARQYASKARVLQPEDFFSVDVISWSTKDLITHSDLSDVNRLEIVVDLLSMFEACDEQSMSMRDLEIFNKRKAEFGNLLKDDTLKEDALERLSSIGSCAGYYLNALMIANEQPGNELTAEAVMSISKAVRYLEQNFQAIQNDGRCVFLLLKYWWIANSGKPFFVAEERQALPFDLDQWRHLLEILNKLTSLDEIYQIPSNNYLRAIATWNLGYFDDAAEIWKDLQRASDSVTGRRRVAKTYISSHVDGKPVFYNGTIESVTEDGNRGTVYVEGIRRKVDFFPRDFGYTDARRGQAISFFISFNYIGPVADPSHHVKP